MTHTRLTLVVCLTALSLALGGSAPVRAQPIERDLYVSVLDKAGAPVAGLDPSAFVVREDGVAREVLRVRPASAPMQIALLVDDSQAATPAIKDLRDGLTAFVEKMHIANEIAIVTIGERPTIVTDYTRDIAALRKGIGRLFARPGSGAYLLDALVETARGLDRREAERPVILGVITEGTEFSNQHYQNVLDRLKASGVAFHAVVLAEPGAAGLESDEIRNRNIVLARATGETGGRREYLLSSMAFRDTLLKVAAELSGQYLVTYARPQSLLQPERVEVSGKQPDWTVRGTPVKARTAKGRP